ncbi:MAG: TIGR01777 family oxidoreductase, partial [candidate division NC10 bacterium]
MNVAVTGSTGLLGSALVPRLTSGSHGVVRLVRGTPATASGERVARWDPDTGAVEPGLDGVDAVVHLAGESVAGGRWTEARKRRIRESRVHATRRLCETLARLSRPPRVLVAASAIGYYGDRGDQVLREESAPGAGFLPEVCREWEAAAEPAARRGIRVVHLRIGLVLSPKGGALAAMLPVFRLGLGGPVGAGAQWMSWIALEDEVGVIQYALSHPEIQGPINLVAPTPLTNREFTKTLGKVLRRPTIFPVPAPMLRLLMGEDVLDHSGLDY